MQRRSLISLPLVAAVTLVAVAPAGAVNTVTTTNGANWQIHDLAPPKLDTGSIRAITDNAFYGFGGIRVRVSDIPANDPTGRLNGELMRGFGLTWDNDETFTTTTPVNLGGVGISRAIKVSKAGNYARWLDSFANTTSRTVTVDVSFGGTAGLNTTNNQSQDRGDVVRRRADRPERHVGLDLLAQRHRREHARAVGGRRHQPERLELPARPVRRAAAGDRAGGQLLRLPQHADAAAGPDQVAAALRRRGPRRDDGDGRRAGQRRRHDRATALVDRAGHRRAVRARAVHGHERHAHAGLQRDAAAAAAGVRAGEGADDRLALRRGRTSRSRRWSPTWPPA